MTDLSKMVQGSQEWLNFRKNKIGSSDAAIIMGVSPWCTPLQLAQRKLGLIPDQIKTDWMQKGLDIEPEIRDWFEIYTGVEVKPAVKQSIEHPWMIGSIDGISDDGKVGIEIKLCSKEIYSMAKKDDLPIYYEYQIQHLMQVFGLNEIYYITCRSDGTDPVMIKILRNEPMIFALIEKEEEFWEDLQNFILPDENENDYQKIDSIEWQRKTLQYNAICDSIKCLEKEQECLKDELIEMAGSRNSIGNGMKLSRVFRKGNVDYKKICEEFNIDIEKYRNRSTDYWKISSY